ncbi:putative protein YhaP [Porphyromonas levii]|nr:putative protein YhaP [Porphyromonas levii]
MAMRLAKQRANCTRREVPMNKFWIVMQREYNVKVKKKSFVLLTIFTPLIFILIIAIPLFLGMNAKDTSEKKVMVIDQTGKYMSYLQDNPKEGIKFVKSDMEISEARKNKSEDIYAYVLITEDLLENPKGITIFSHSTIPPTLQTTINDDLQPALRKEKIASYDIPNLEQIIDDTKVNLSISEVQWSKDGEEQAASSTVAMIIGQAFNIMLFFFVITYGSMVMTSVQEEKKNRIVEIIASSVKPTTLLFAKMVAVALVGLTQLGIWIILGAIGFFVMQAVFLSNVTIDMDQLTQNAMTSGVDAEFIQDVLMPLTSFDFAGMIWAFVFFFICAYLSFASIYAAMGAAFDSDEDIQQMSLPITLLFMFAFYAALHSAENPNGPLALWGSFIPFVAPNVMMVRLPFAPPVWQIVLSAVVMVATTVFFVWAAAKVFRVGLLMYGKKPSFKELVKWVKYK